MLVAATSMGTGSAHAGSFTQAKDLKIAVSLPDMSFPFFIHMAQQIQDEAAQIGGISVEVFDGKNQTGTQNDDLQKVIDGEFDGLLVAPINATTLAPAVQAVIDADIPVVTVDRSISGVEVLAHVSADNVRGGEAQGNLILQLFPNGAKVFNIQGTPGATPAIARNRGLLNVLRGKDAYPITFEKTGNFNAEDGKKVVAEGLDSAGTPDVISCANDGMALGAIEVLKERGLIGKVAVIGYDALPEALMAIQNGEMTGTVEQFPGGQSREALNILITFVREGSEPAQVEILLDPLMITNDNFDKAERLAELAPAATPEATMDATMEATPDATPNK
jgi:ABC-type sugar transport system substrate-binding protein